MAQESNKNIDQIFKERLSDFGTVPSNDVWNNIDQSLTVRSRRKKVLLSSFLLSIIITGSLFTYNYYNQDSSNSENNYITTQREFKPVIKDIKKGALIKKRQPSDKSNEPVTIDISRPQNNIKTITQSEDATLSENIAQEKVKTTEEVIITETEETTPDVTIIDAIRPSSNTNPPFKNIKKTESILEKNDTLTLSIEFANLERKLADKITIEQTIPDFLDINSLNPIKSSHVYKYKVKKSQRKIIWTLKNIPAKGNKASSGYIDYDVVVIKEAKESQLKSKEVLTFDYGYYRTKTTN